MPQSRTLVGRIAALDADRTIVVRFTDTDGLVNREPVTFTLAALPDDPPQVAMRLRGISTAVTPRARVPLVGTISDDHGLGGAAVRLRVADGGESVLIAACDSFRTGAVEQLKRHAEALGVELFQQGYAKDPVAIAQAAIRKATQMGVRAVLAETFERMKEHLAKNDVDLSKDKLTLGPVLKMNGKTERFIDHDAANAMLKDTYREPFVVPEIS
jgi:hypothetical protein